MQFKAMYNQCVSVFPNCDQDTSSLLCIYKQTKVIILFISDRMHTHFIFLFIYILF